jgi:ABC-type lipoprotein release transport system permease subunit
MLGIIIGVIVLITVLSIMNGFEKELRERILSMVAHVTVTASDGQLPDWELHQFALQTKTGIAGSAPYIEQQVMLSANNEVRGVQIQGVLPAYQDQVSEVSRHIIDGEMYNLTSRGYGIAIGVDLAASLGIFVGDKVTVITPNEDKTVLSPSFSTRIINGLSILCVPPVTLSIIFLLTGRLSPVSKDSLTLLCPSMTIPSTGIISPGFTSKVSPS